MRPLSAIHPYPGNPRVNDDAVAAVARSLAEFGFRQPIVVDTEGVIIAGHTRYKAAQKLGLDRVPIHVAKDLSPERVRAYRIADNASAEKSEWDFDLLPIELNALKSADYDLAMTALDPKAIASLLYGDGRHDDEKTGTDPGDGAYREQYGVIVICRDAAQQEAVFERLKADGHECRVVCT